MIPVTLLKYGRKTNIVGFSTLENHKPIIKKLQSLGFVRGREVELLDKKGRLYLLRVSGNNPFCLDKGIANDIFVNPNQQDIIATSNKKNIFSIFKNMINRLNHNS